MASPRLHLFTALCLLPVLLGVLPAFADPAGERRALLAEHTRLTALPRARLVPVADGKVLHPGDRDGFVTQLRAAVAAYGYPSGARADAGSPIGLLGQLEDAMAETGYVFDPPPPPDPLVYDEALVESVERFQGEAGLVPDGIVGGMTRKALRAMDNDRLRMIEQSLAQPDPPSKGRYLWVNLAAGMVYAMEDGVPVLSSRVVVGNKDNTTPTFSSRVAAVWVNPSWVVPDSIVMKEFGGNPHTEKPGPNNPLGRLLLEMSNQYEVFLHSTNQPSLFDRDVRAFSHGCVRVKEIEAFARWLLGDARWQSEGVDAALTGLTTHRIALDQSVAIYIDYRTATLASTGAVIYHPDPYLLAAPPPPEPPPAPPVAVTAAAPPAPTTN